MMHQVDLRAADVDRAHASRLSLPHPFDRLHLGVEEVRLTLGIDRPRPGLTHARGLVAPAALDDPDRLQQPGGDAMPRLGGNQCRPAHSAGCDCAGRGRLPRTRHVPRMPG